MESSARAFSLAARTAAVFATLISAAFHASAAETSVSLTRLPDKTYEVSGFFTVDASTTVVWGVLTDYEKIPSFVSAMRLSRVQENRRDGSLLVAQRAVGELFFLSKTMRILLEVRRSPEFLRFTDVGHQDFRTYDGEWEVRPLSVGARVNYHLLVEPGFAAPAFIMSRTLKRGARDLLDQVRAEIVRRELAR